MTPFKLTDELLVEIQQLIADKHNADLRAMMQEFHYADIAEIADELEVEEATSWQVLTKQLKVKKKQKLWFR